MATHALLLSNDPHSYLLLQQVFAEFEVKTDLCLNAASAKQLLQQRRYESVIVDCDSVHDGLSVIHEVRATEAIKDTVTVTLLRDPEQLRQAADMGTTFVLHKPVPTEDARRIMRIARRLLSREAVRQYLRLPLTQLAFALLDEEKQILVENVSEGGMAIQAEEELAIGSVCKVRFALPHEDTIIAAEAKICWADGSGRAGLQFTAIDADARARLSRWIETAYAAGVPDADGNRRVVLDVPARLKYSRNRPSRWAALSAAVAIDLALGVSATAFFMAMVWIFAGQVVSASQILLVALLFCATYHYLFVVHRRRTLGAVLMGEWIE